MSKKNLLKLVLATLVVALFSSTYFIEAEINKENKPNETKNENNQKQENERDRLYLDYLNLEGENQNLHEEIELLEDEIFELRKLLVSSDSFIDYLPSPETTKILYKETDESSFATLYTDETGIYLLLASNEPKYNGNIHISTLNPAEGVNWSIGSDPNHYMFGGVITNKEIHNLQVWLNDNIHKSKIIKINEEVNIWYSVFEYDKKSNSKESDKIKLEALDNNGIILWEESLEFNLEG